MMFRIKRSFAFLIMVAAALVLISAVLPMQAEAATKPSLTYRARVQGTGWQDAVSNGEMAGTKKNLRLEALKLYLDPGSYTGTIQYRAKVQDSGWETSWKEAGQISGTVGKNLRLEAVKFRLTGQLAEDYDIWYCVYVEQAGWLNWTRNGAAAGTGGLNRKIEAIRIKLIRKGANRPGQPGAHTAACLTAPTLKIGAWQEKNGWLGTKQNGKVLGDPGSEKGLTGLRITSFSAKESGTVKMLSYVTGSGWEKTKATVGAASGMPSKGKGIEAVRFYLTGRTAQDFDIYYCVRVPGMGWMNWAKNGDACGMPGYGDAIEAVLIKILPKGAKAPEKRGAAVRACISASSRKEAANQYLTPDFTWSGAGPTDAKLNSVNASGYDAYVTCGGTTRKYPTYRGRCVGYVRWAVNRYFYHDESGQHYLPPWEYHPVLGTNSDHVRVHRKYLWGLVNSGKATFVGRSCVNTQKVAQIASGDPSKKMYQWQALEDRIQPGDIIIFGSAVLPSEWKTTKNFGPYVAEWSHIAMTGEKTGTFTRNGKQYSGHLLHHATTEGVIHKYTTTEFMTKSGGNFGVKYVEVFRILPQ